MPCALDLHARSQGLSEDVDISILVELHAFCQNEVNICYLVVRVGVVTSKVST